MVKLVRKILFSFLFNSSLFFVLIIGIQNSSNKSKVNLLVNETINLPIGFIVGTSFISGSIIGTLLGNMRSSKKDKFKELLVYQR